MGVISGLIRIILFALNLAIWVSGVLLLVFGAIAVGNPDTMVTILNIIPGVSGITILIDVAPLFQGVAIFMIVLGSVLILFGFVGFHGAARSHKHSLFLYSLLSLAGMLTEIALIIYAALYSNSSSATDYINTQMLSSLNTSFAPVTFKSGTIVYAQNGTQANAWEVLQAQSDCCGAIGPQDYDTAASWQAIQGNNTLPPTCCKTNVKLGVLPTSESNFVDLNSCQSETSEYYTIGCNKNVQNMVYEFDLISIIISACLLAAQLVAIIFTCHSWHKMYREEGFA
jgi:hypothetical protein